MIKKKEPLFKLPSSFITFNLFLILTHFIRKYNFKIKTFILFLTYFKIYFIFSRNVTKNYNS